MNTEEMLVNAIVIGRNHRAVNETTVAEIANSVAEIGLTNPTSVRRMEAGRPYLIAGRQRLEAFKKLKRETIRAIVFDDDDMQAKIRELDENLCRAELSPAEGAAAELERKQVYETMHPETKQGGDRKSQVVKSSGQNGRLKADSYSATAAKATGRSERSIRRAAERGEKISGGALALVKGTRLDTGTYLDGLKNVPAKEQVAKVTRDLAAPKKKQPRVVKDDLSPTPSHQMAGDIVDFLCRMPIKKYTPEEAAAISDPEMVAGINRYFDPTLEWFGRWVAAWEQRRDADEIAEVAANEAVEMLVRCLGAELPRFKEAFARAGYRFHSKLAAAVERRL